MYKSLEIHHCEEQSNEASPKVGEAISFRDTLIDYFVIRFVRIPCNDMESKLILDLLGHAIRYNINSVYENIFSKKRLCEKKMVASRC